MTPAHTPGPWDCQGSDAVGPVFERTTGERDARGWPITERMTVPNAVAAAAPDLLAALKMVLGGEGGHTADDGTRFYCCCPRYSVIVKKGAIYDRADAHATGCKEARSALAKAEGGKS